MKLIYFVLFAIASVYSSSLYAQDETPTPSPATAVPPAATVPPTAKPAPAKAMPVQETVKGNAARDVSIVNAPGSCSGPMKGVGIINKSATKPVITRIEVSTTYNGHVSKKQVTVDNIAPNETRSIGCSGCIDNPTGQTCSTYKLLIAVYK